MLTSPTLADLMADIPPRSDIQVLNLRSAVVPPDQVATADVQVGGILALRGLRIVWATYPSEDDADKLDGFYMVLLPASVRQYADDDSRPGLSLDWRLLIQIEGAVLDEWARQMWD